MCVCVCQSASQSVREKRLTVPHGALHCISCLLSRSRFGLGLRFAACSSNTSAAFLRSVSVAPLLSYSRAFTPPHTKTCVGCERSILGRVDDSCKQLHKLLKLRLMHSFCRSERRTRAHATRAAGTRKLQNRSRLPLLHTQKPENLKTNVYSPKPDYIGLPYARCHVATTPADATGLGVCNGWSSSVAARSPRKICASTSIDCTPRVVVSYA